ncbi:Hypothetical protein HVR_LOCUS1185 [uncultured virus]|nr:Hypothetical protein HVR_LOCUS1185 [uncultured virus]
MDPSALHRFVSDKRGQELYKNYLMSLVALLDNIKESVFEEFKDTVPATRSNLVGSKAKSSLPGAGHVDHLNYTLDGSDSKSCEKVLQSMLSNNAFRHVLLIPSENTEQLRLRIAALEENNRSKQQKIDRIGETLKKFILLDVKLSESISNSGSQSTTSSEIHRISNKREQKYEEQIKQRETELTERKERWKKVTDDMMKEHEEDERDYIEFMVKFAAHCNGNGIDGRKVTKDFVKVYDKRPMYEIDRNTDKIVHKYTCEMAKCSTKSKEGEAALGYIKSQRIATLTPEEIVDEIEQEEKRLQRKDKVRKGLDENSITFKLREYAEAHPDIKVYWNF